MPCDCHLLLGGGEAGQEDESVAGSLAGSVAGSVAASRAGSRHGSRMSMQQRCALLTPNRASLVVGCGMDAVCCREGMWVVLKPQLVIWRKGYMPHPCTAGITPITSG